MARVAVVGAGVGGLVTAALARQAGHSVVLYESAEQLGGRARSTEHDLGSGRRVRLNLGPHAYFAAGAARRVLQRLGVKPRGFTPPTRGVLAWRDGVVEPFLDPRRAWVAARLAAAAPRSTLQVGPWLDELPATREPMARAFAEALIRVTTYCVDRRLSAVAAAAQVRRALIGGVRYLDEGWQSIVDPLAERCRALGVELRTRARINDLDALDADRLVLAVPPNEVSRLTGRRVDLTPLRTANLDLVLDGLPVPRRRAVFGVGAPWYFAVHTRPGVKGPVVAHAMQYLAADTTGDRAGLEAFLDSVQPSWRERVLHARYLPSLTAQHGMVDGSPVPSVALDERTLVVGDWVGARGLLLDRSVGAADDAARLLAVASTGTMAA